MTLYFVSNSQIYQEEAKNFPISFSPFQLFVYESRFEKFVRLAYRMSWLKGIPKLRNCFANQLSCRHDNLKARVCVNWKAIGSHFLFSFTLDFHVYIFLPMREFSSLCDCISIIEGSWGVLQRVAATYWLLCIKFPLELTPVFNANKWHAKTRGGDDDNTFELSSEAAAALKIKFQKKNSTIELNSELMAAKQKINLLFTIFHV